MPAKKSAWEMAKDRSTALLKNLERLAADIEEFVAAGRDPLRGVTILQAELDRWQKATSDLADRGRRALEALQKNRDSAAETFEARLARELREKGYEVHGESALLIVNGIVHLETVLREATVRINAKAAAELSPGAIVTAVSEEVGRITPILTPPSDLIEQLIAAYDRELKLAERPAGAQVHTLALLPHLALARQRPAFMHNPSTSNYREYPRELFRADLYTLLRSGKLQSGDRQLRYASGSDTAGAIFMMVPALGRPAHIGRMWFEPTS
jgi:hypothetical protein